MSQACSRSRLPPFPNPPRSPWSDWEHSLPLSELPAADCAFDRESNNSVLVKYVSYLSWPSASEASLVGSSPPTSEDGLRIQTSRYFPFARKYCFGHSMS